MSNKIWFISDVHFTHLNAMKFKPKRMEYAGITMKEFENGNKNELMAKHDAWLITKWNDTIDKKDIIYILGDFCLGNKDHTEYILNKLHGKKYLITGNHDKSCHGLSNYFEWIGSIKEAKFNHEQFPFIRENETFCIEMCHFPMLSWNRRPHGTCMVHGHVHGSLDDINKVSKELRVDVGLDAELSNYNFISLEQLYNYFTDIIVKADCNTFQEYSEKLMNEQGFRM